MSAKKPKQEKTSRQPSGIDGRLNKKQPLPPGIADRRQLRVLRAAARGRVSVVIERVVKKVPYTSTDDKGKVTNEVREGERVVYRSKGAQWKTIRKWLDKGWLTEDYKDGNQQFFKLGPKAPSIPFTS